MASLAYVGLGSNLGHPRRHLARAVHALAGLPRTRLVAASGNYVSAPIGTSEPQPDYVNAVAILRTALGPGAMLRQLCAVERRHGRRREPGERRNAPRVLDLGLSSIRVLTNGKPFCKPAGSPAWRGCCV